jgi:hypothetical protein
MWNRKTALMALWCLLAGAFAGATGAQVVETGKRSYHNTGI